MWHSGPLVIPDFIISKATQFSTHDTTLLVVEVKGPDSEEELSRQQLYEYMERICQQHQRNTKLVGLLVSAATIEVYTIEIGGNIESDEIQYDLTSDADNKAVWQVLHDIATDNWTYAD